MSVLESGAGNICLNCAEKKNKEGAGKTYLAYTIRAIKEGVNAI